MPRNLREALKGKLSDEELRLLRAFDIIGDIAVVKLPEQLLPEKRLIGEALMQVHRHVRTVLRQVGAVRGEFRTRELEVIAGEPRTETVHREAGCTFAVDLSKVYFSPRLAYERMRIARLVKPGEVVTNMFAGVGCYSIVAAKHSRAARVYSVDKNPFAFEYMLENIRINKVGDCVVPFLGDVREVVEERIAGLADRVLMPLPELARDFFDVAIEALKPQGGVVHFYDLGQLPDPFVNSIALVKRKAAERGVEIEILGRRSVRSFAPKRSHVVLDLAISPRK